MKPKIRFEIFKRDGFVCQYCGQKPPFVILEVDHVIPKKLGGTDDKDNLLTACHKCNRGKAARTLTCLPESLKQRTEDIKERARQVKAYERALYEERRRENVTIDILNDMLLSYTGCSFTEQFIERTLRKFVKQITFRDLEWAFEKALDKTNKNPDMAIKYFCGICWKWIKSGEVTRG